MSRRQHDEQLCITPDDLPAVRLAPWQDPSFQLDPVRYPERPKTTEYAAMSDADVAGYADEPRLLFVDGREVTVAEAEEQARAVLAVLAAMRADGVLPIRGEAS